MKKLLVLLFSILISFNSYGIELNTFFGISLNDNAEKYVASNYIDSNKYKNTETSGGYFNLVVTDKIKSKNPYFSFYLIVIDNNNKIHSIYAHYEFDNMEICQTVHKSLLEEIESKYGFKTFYDEKPYPTFKISSNSYLTDVGNYFSLQCKEIYDDESSMLQIILDTSEMSDTIDAFYESGM